MPLLRYSCLTALTFLLAASASSQQANPAQSDGLHSSHGNAGGQAVKGGPTEQLVGDFKIQTMIGEKGITFSVATAQGRSVDTSAGSGTLSLKVGDRSKEYVYPVKPLKDGCLGVAVNLSKVLSYDLHLNVELRGITDDPLQFHTMGRVAASQLPDALLIRLQGSCPVSGQSLGSMGKPVKVELGAQSLFVCCAGCVDKLKQSADTHLDHYYKATGRELRAGVLQATLADADAIAAQKVCPVMEEPLGGMGVPGKVLVKGAAVYICCPGCAKKLVAEPDKYLAILGK